MKANASIFRKGSSMRLLAVAAVGAVSIGLCSAAGAAVLVQDDFQSDSPGALSNGQSGQRYLRATDSGAAIVNSTSDPVDPFGDAGNQSLMAFDKLGTSGSNATVGYNFASQMSGSASLKLYVENSTDFTAPYGYIRFGNNPDAATTSATAAQLGPWLLIDGREPNNTAPILSVLESKNGDGTGGTNYVGTDAALSFNTAQTIGFSFDADTDSFSMTLDGQPIHPRSDATQTSFPFYTPLSDITNLEVVAGSSGRPNVRFFYDDVLVQSAVPEPASLGLLGLAGMGLLRRRRRQR